MIELTDNIDATLYTNTVVLADCAEYLRRFPDNSFDACPTDPPYGLEFMNKDWDKLGIDNLISDADDWVKLDPITGKTQVDPVANKPRFAQILKDDATFHMLQFYYVFGKELLRVLKHGGHVAAFAGTRTSHIFTFAMQLAGFEPRTTVYHIYGSGFPKGLHIAWGIMKKQLYKWLEDYPDVLAKLKSLKGIQHRDFKIRLMLKAGIARLGEYVAPDGKSRPFKVAGWNHDDKEGLTHKKILNFLVIPNTPEAMKWYDWNTQLKPAAEPIKIFRKPLSEKNTVENILKWGTGALNIGACRIAVNPNIDDMNRNVDRKPRESPTWENGSGFKNENNPRTGVLPIGRYPSNFIISHLPECELIEQGEIKATSKARRIEPCWGKYGIYGEGLRSNVEYDFDKDSKPEIWRCAEGCPVRMLNEQSGEAGAGGKIPLFRDYDTLKYEFFNDSKTTTQKFVYGDSGGAARFFYCPKASPSERNYGLEGRNKHITVKPIKLMQYLIRLITPPDGIIIDPFLGSGTTAIASEKEGFYWYGCDNNPEYCQIADTRIKAWRNKKD